MKGITLADNKVLCFFKKRWYLVDFGNNVNREVVRSEAKSFLMELKPPDGPELPGYLWMDLLHNNDQPIKK